MISTSLRSIYLGTLSLALLAASPCHVALAQQALTSELQEMTKECRAARNECYRTCVRPSRNLERGLEVSDADIKACRSAHARLNPQTQPEPAWSPDYATMPDVVGVFRGALVVAQGRDDWKRHCGSSALIGDVSAPKPWDVPKGATVKVSGVRYVTNPIKSFDRKKTACVADGVEVLSAPAP